MGGRFRKWLGLPVSGSSLAVIRIGFGLVMAYEAFWFLGWIPFAPREPTVAEYLYTGDHIQWHFSYPGFGWVAALPEPWMSGVFYLMAAASLLVAVGFFYRAAIVTVLLTFSYVLLLEASQYVNHFYLAMVTAFLLAWMPADRCFSIRSLLSRGSVTPLVPRWSVFLLRVQMFVIYFYAGIAKINPDWLVGEPLRIWLRQPSIGGNLAMFFDAQTMDNFRHFVGREEVVWSLAYGGLIFDLTIGFLLICRRTRLMALSFVGLFHAINFCLFEIGAFPIMAICLTSIFLAPDWPISFRQWLVQRATNLFRFKNSLRQDERQHRVSVSPIRVPNISRFSYGLILCCLTWQFIFPLRHFAIPGNVSWTEEGHWFSWHMMLRMKQTELFQISIDDSEMTTESCLRNFDIERSLGTTVDSKREIASTRFIHTDSNNIAWHQLPPIVVTYEPIVGERIFLNPLSGDNWGEAAQRARSWWQRHFGPPELVPTDRLSRSLRSIAFGILKSSSDHRKQHVEVVRDLQIAIDLLENVDPSGSRSHEIESVIRRLVKNESWRKPILNCLAQAQPFALQGNAAHDAPFMIFACPQLLQDNRHCLWKIDRQQWPEQVHVLIDLPSLTTESMRSLPHVLCFATNADDVQLVWNETRELHQAQVQAMRTSPFLQFQYAQHVADIWERQFGRRVEVRITNRVSMNRRTAQPMIDGRVDLASKQWRYFGHNDWIVPLGHTTTGERLERSIAENQPVK